MKAVFLIQGNGPVRFLRQAYAQLEERYREKLEITIADTNDLDGQEAPESFIQYFGKPDFFYLDIHGGLPYFKRFDQFWKEIKGKIPAFVRTGIDDENTCMRREGGVSPLVYDQIMAYLHAGGVENMRGILLLLLREFGDCPGIAASPVYVPAWDGIYGLPEGMSEEEYLDRLAAEEEKPVIGILVHYHHILQEDTEHIDALMEAVNAYGAIPLAVYTNMMPSENGYGGLKEAIRHYLKRGGKSLIDALIVTTGHSLTALAAPGDGREYSMDSVFAELDVPVFQAMTTYFTREQWEKSPAGIDAMLLCCCVYQPEFDGQIITVPVACTEQVMTEYGVKSRTVPLTDRVEKTVRLAINWGRLRKIPEAKKKIAIVFHNMPPRADMIGCAYGLDTPESVYGMYQVLKEKGFTLDYDFADGQEIIRRIIEGTTNDGRFLSEEDMLARCQAVVEKEQYLAWFSHMPEKNRRELERDWGTAPGTFMAAEEKLLVPGILNGNLFIGLQPPRAMEEKAEEAYHSTDIVCPHQYLAFYRYLEKVFCADLVVHVGTHGTIEWLPGKEIGLSGECYPDLAIGDMPHLYPYIIDVPGEGVQAKRRTGAVLLEHCIPSMTESGTYGAMEELDGQVDAWYHAKTADPGKLPALEAEIWERMTAENLHTDLEITEEEFQKTPEKAIERLHLWLSEIKGSKIKDGLHIFGKAPEKERFWSLVRMLVSIFNGDVPSLREAIAEEAGENLEALLAAPGERRADGRTNAMRLEELDEQGRAYFAQLAECVETCGTDEALRRFGELPGKLGKCLRFVLTEAAPRLARVTEELDFFARAVDGRFVAPGPSGAPTRGNARLLPTGRNFYTIDPTAVPSRSSWKTGKLLGDQLLAGFCEEQGKYPESVAIVVYSGETMKTRGDDIAEILYLYGVRPVWLENTDRVIGLELIPLEELGRPRIDVTLRISGLFRDTFPNLIERIEDAVNLAASLPEPEEQNYIRKHIHADLEEFLRQGMEREQAYERASLRVFGCPPGTYGAGVDILVNSKKWTSTEDLGRAYMNWSSHGYSRSMHGEKAEELFARRLQTCEATVKNISSFEADMLDSDDFYNYHGGLISAVKTVSGKNPKSYSTNAADPAHVKTRSVEAETARIMRARICNPKWQEGLKKHGYKGAQEFSAMVDILFGWDATSGVAEDWMYEAIARDYMLKEEMREWMTEVNPFAVHAISERLLEASRRGMWEAKEETLGELERIYLSIDGDMEGMECC